MIERYSREEMKAVWSEENRYRQWMKVETAVCVHMASQGIIKPAEWKKLKPALESLIKKGIDPARVTFHEKTLRHDVIAFTTTVAESIGELSRYIHFGLTSSDVIDSAQALVMKEANDLLLQDLDRLMKEVLKRAKETKNLPTIGRSHGIFAEPTSFGLKFLGFYSELERSRCRLEQAGEALAYGKLSGAVGVNAHYSPQEEEKMLKTLELKREPVSTQVIPRDRHAEWLNAMALVGASLERMSVELRHLQRSEVGEVMEGFKKGQKGSSAMPHKRNPISSENITGCARLLRSYAQAGVEDIALWHERDISHSSVERVILPDASILLDYALNRMTDLIAGLVINQSRVKANLDSAGSVVFSGHFLLALVKQGALREEAYYWIQECAHQSLESGKSMIVYLEKHPEIRKFLSTAEIKKYGSLKYQLRNVSEIFNGVKTGKAE